MSEATPQLATKYHKTPQHQSLPSSSAAMLLPTLLRLANARPESVIPLGQDAYLVHHPEHVKHVLQTNNRNYTRRPLLEKAFPLLGEGLVTSEGALWQRQRRLMQPAFHRRHMERLTDTMSALILEMLDRWELLADQHQPLDIFTEMKHITMQIVVGTMFGFRLGKHTEPIGEAFQVASGHLKKRLQNKSAGEDNQARQEFEQALHRLDEIVYEIIEQRRSLATAGDDLLAMLLAAHDNTDLNGGMTDKQLRDEIMTLFVSGHETTTDALTWLWYLLATHPDVVANIQNETDQLKLEKMTFQDFPALAYTRLVVDEALRMYPPVSVFGRITLEQDMIDGLCIPAGARVILSPYITHRHPQFWPEPDKFWPERFGSGAESHPRFAYIPFSHGPRQCIGDQFALVEIQLLVAMATQRYVMTPLPAHPITPPPGHHHGEKVLLKLSRRG
jgi:cytochrome P450